MSHKPSPSPSSAARMNSMHPLSLPRYTQSIIPSHPLPHSHSPIYPPPLRQGRCSHLVPGPAALRLHRHYRVAPPPAAETGAAHPADHLLERVPARGRLLRRGRGGRWGCACGCGCGCLFVCVWGVRILILLWRGGRGCLTWTYRPDHATAPLDARLLVLLPLPLSFAILHHHFLVDVVLGDGTGGGLRPR